MPDQCDCLLSTGQKSKGHEQKRPRLASISQVMLMTQEVNLGFYGRGQQELLMEIEHPNSR
ncbi:hypothetical protein STEG23_026482, partial [Scotinomys teguina]